MATSTIKDPLYSRFPQAGYGALTGVTTTEKSVDVKFPRAFPFAPYVVVSLYNASYNRRVHVSNITTTGFKATGALTSGSGTASIEFEWVAVLP